MSEKSRASANALGLVGQPVIQNATQVAVDVIREAILSGGLAPGTRLRESDLASELGLSRTPVREALLMLQAQGVVDAFPNRGAVVPKRSRQYLCEIYELRALLEGCAARLAASRASSRHHELLLESCERLESCAEDEIDGLISENVSFHEIVLDAAGNARLHEMVRQVRELPLIYRTYVWRFPEQRQSSCEAHRTLTEALTQRDVQRAEEIMKNHIHAAGEVLVEHVEALGDQM